MTNTLCYTGARDARRAFLSGELSPVELLTAVLERSDEVDDSIRAFVARYDEDAMAQARESEARYTRGEPIGPLDGIPVAIKDETAIAGRVTTLSTLLHDGLPDKEDAPVVARIKAAGGIIHARTATPEFSSAPFTHSRRSGISRNPWNLAFDPGGSSGGSASALAAGMTTLADGSDLGGSIRCPASFCGVVGYKPPYGRVPSTMPDALDTFNHQGPLARSVADAALLQNVLSGWHPRDPATVREEVVIPEKLGDVRGSRIAVSYDLGGYRVDDEVVRNVRRVVDALEEAGATVEEVDLHWRAEEVREAMLAHFAAIFAPQLERYTAGRLDEVSDYTLRLLDAARRGASRGLYSAVDLESKITTDLARIFERNRVLLCPTNSAVGLAAGESYLTAGPPVNGIPLADVYDMAMTTPFNLASRCPVLAVPSGFSSVGVPTGVQVVGSPFDDLSVFHVGASIEQRLGVASVRPGALAGAAL